MVDQKNISHDNMTILMRLCETNSETLVYSNSNEIIKTLTPYLVVLLPYMIVYATPHHVYHTPTVYHPGGHYSKILNAHQSNHSGYGVYHTP